MAISYFQPPKTSTAARPCSLKVASVSMEPPAVLVHTLPLRKYRHGDGPVRKGRPPRTPRYVLALKSKPPSMVGLVLFIAAVVLALAVVLQGSLEIWGLSDPVLGARHVTPTSWHRPRQVPRPRPRPGQFLGGHLSTLKPGERPLLRVGAAAGGGEAVQVVAHDREQHGGGGREWDAMHPAERQAWKEKLVEAGHWAEGMGETVFKGILFGELAGAVGNMVGG
ncbi:hypothetical protein P8C59_004817 [Phyllachora maydis]|nr:hypothetical protein P8C59_004817 [Phyllachora maydis]